MNSFSNLTLAPLHRPGWQSGGVSVAERWSWDFIVDGRSLNGVISADVAGALGWGDATWEASVVDKLLRRASPDLPPDRVALYVCPECGDLGCGALTAAIVIGSDSIIWSDFAWERSWDGAPDDKQYPNLGPFRFEPTEYARVLQGAIEARPDARKAPLDAG